MRQIDNLKMQDISLCVYADADANQLILLCSIGSLALANRRPHRRLGGRAILSLLAVTDNSGGCGQRASDGSRRALGLVACPPLAGAVGGGSPTGPLLSARGSPKLRGGIVGVLTPIKR